MKIQCAKLLVLLCALGCGCARDAKQQPQAISRAECWDLHAACLVLEGKGDGIDDAARRQTAERITSMMKRLRPRGGWLSD